MDTATAFAVIQRSLEDFNADVLRARADQAQSEETLAAVEYEMEQLRKLIAENALDRFGKKPVNAPSRATERTGETLPYEPLKKAG